MTLPCFLKRYNKQECLIKDASHQKIWRVLDKALLFIVWSNQAGKVVCAMAYRSFYYDYVYYWNIVQKREKEQQM